ncbi:MAG: PQQ-dependent sugar dehydrogenase [Lentisphaeraceae bacterium]|nr:PQQ-dependent sugar dehydrogenase [Lentisphaeraceae bacterium]
MNLKIWFLSILVCSSLVAAPKAEHFKVDILAEGFTDPQEMVMLPDGKILICQRTGQLRMWDPVNGLTEAGFISTTNRDKTYARECGFIGLTADPDFAKNGYLYCFYSNPAKHLPEYEKKHKKDKFAAKQKDALHVNRLSRFTFKNGKLDNSSEKMILEVPTDRYNSTCHEAGSMAFGPDGLLYISTGDNTNPFSKPATPIEENKKELDAQRSASNSNDLRGKVLRIKINKDATYSIPKGNLFKPGTPKTRPEIYAMGLRNPYRITINSKTGTLYWGEVAPDKNPTGEEINQAKTAGYYGWPYVITDTQVFKDLKGKAFDPKNLKNTSKNNTGIINLPEPREPFHFYGRSCSIIGGVYHTASQNSPTAFPAHYDNHLFFADWNKSWFKAIKMDKNENKVSVTDFKLNFKFRKPIDIFFAKGEMYVLEYGNGWYNVKSGRLLRVSYSTRFNQQTTATADPRLAGMNTEMKGAKEMLTATCLSCHTAQDKILGPTFADIAIKYKNDPAAIKTLIDKVKKGGAGVWGEQPMPAHPFYSDEKIKSMIEAILKTEKLGGHHE